MPESGTPNATTEVEASSFSIWNCVITFLQILLISTMLYGSGWSQGQMYNLSPETMYKFQHFRAVAFFFSVWALQSVALALLLVWAIGKRSYHLCHSWILCETLMQVFIVVSCVYLLFRSHFAYGPGSTRPISESPAAVMSHHQEDGLRLPRHFIFLIILHFLIKGFGFWIVRRYMKVLKATVARGLISSALSSNSDNVLPHSSTGDESACYREASPPPAYAHLCKDELPCYDDAVRLCLKDETVNDFNKESSVVVAGKVSNA